MRAIKQIAPLGHETACPQPTPAAGNQSLLSGEKEARLISREDRHKAATIRLSSPLSSKETGLSKVQCPQCQKSLKYLDEHAGKKTKCPQCGKILFCQQPRPSERSAA
jgi:ribosomal protein S27E